MITILTASNAEELQAKANRFARTHNITQIQYKVVGNAVNALFTLAILWH